MKKLVIVLGLAVTGLAGCKNFEKGEGDMLYKIHTDKSGETIKEGDFVAFKAIEKTEGDSVLYSSYDYDRPSLLVKEKSVFKGDLFAALGLLSEGDSATFKINIDSMVQKMGRPQPSDTTKKYLVYTIKIDKVIPKGKLTDSLFRGKIDAFLKTEMDQAKTGEANKVKAYVSAKSLKPTVTATGLNYVVTTQGSGPKANPGDTVLVNYTGMFLSGKVFDSSLAEVAKKNGTFNPQRPYEPLKLPVGMNGSIAGFEEGLMLLPKGAKATLILPSSLAYGEQGNQGIPPFTPLIFEVDVVNIIPAKAGSALAPAAPALK
ncbi:FKBP-type peptidyl-prolyl cis-trans isomerase [Daejeonella sp.]|jgi:FKBP-type peptidyl-prolyl cis-trans isomerase FkpA|uniref:FKBP-type peptidyl-prolyl cis-trans isomerase n=1 Tax=Daejeonella sp. TaxID=2805397 RepID=UPI0027B8C255|nr:FKBP-type peptidyl-prolyl cis-trans isomerase [Daejeonella sp.]